ncbi:MAG: HDOD domain-containing protein [Desulfobacterales bacterium]|nr:HDOD domain-containing protein [Desulfobacterales bacterium]
MPKAVPPFPSKEIFKAAERLPPFPEVIWKVMSLLRQMAPVSEIEAVIQYDQAIAAKVLALSRSAYYARRYSIGSLKDAIVALGDQELIQLVMAACSARYFEPEISGYELREGALWQHSVATALISDTVARRLGKKKALTIYTAALLHDIGKAVLSFYVKTYLDTILERITRKGLQLLDAERETLGVDHQRLGETIARRWHFPPEVVAGIGYHHCPKEARSHQDVAAAVYVADQTATAMGFGCGVESLVGLYDNRIFDVIGISSDMFQQFWADIIVAMEEIKGLLCDKKAIFGERS